MIFFSNPRTTQLYNLAIFAPRQVCPGQEYQRKLHPDDHPLRAQTQRTQKGEQCHFLVRKNPHYPRRKQILPPIIETTPMTTTSSHSLGAEPIAATMMATSTISAFRSSHHATTPDAAADATHNAPDEPCKMCKNNFKCCEFCNKSVVRKLSTRHSIGGSGGGVHHTAFHSSPSRIARSYSPVYNIREIRTVCHSFSSLGIDKKLLEVERHNLRNNQHHHQQHNTISNNGAAMRLSLSTPLHDDDGGGETDDTTTTTTTTTATKSNLPNGDGGGGSVVMEVVHNNPAKGFGNFIYI